MMAEFQEAMKAWYDKHIHCPRCGGEEFQETTMGWWPFNDARNPNTSTCQNPKCRWKGPSEDLLP